MQALSEMEKEQALRNIQASWAMEGMILTEEDLRIGRAILNGDLNVDDCITQLKERYKKDSLDEK